MFSHRFCIGAALVCTIELVYVGGITLPKHQRLYSTYLTSEISRLWLKADRLGKYESLRVILLWVAESVGTVLMIVINLKAIFRTQAELSYFFSLSHLLYYLYCFFSLGDYKF